MLCALSRQQCAAQASAYMMAQVSTVPTPDFRGMTMEQVKARETLPAKVKGQAPTLIFRGIIPTGPEDGLVVSQTPAVNVPVYPGRGNLSLTFAAPQKKPSQNALADALANLFKAKPQPVKTEPQTTVPSLLGDTCQVATAMLEKRRLRATCAGDSNGVVAGQYPAANTSVAIGSMVQVTLQARMVVVPRVVDQTLADAINILKEKQLQLGTVTGEAKTEPPLPIVFQTPSAGTSVPVDTAVEVTLRTPQAPPPPTPVYIVVPYVQKMSRVEAQKVLESVGLAVGTVTGPDAGQVKDEIPLTGTQVEKGTPVNLTLEIPVVMVDVPDLVGHSVPDAEQQLSGLKLNDEVHYPDGNGDRTTMEVETQDPAPGTSVPQGSRVVLQMDGGSETLPWTWIGLGAAGLLGAGLVTLAIWRLLVRPPLVKTYAHANREKIKTTCKKEPAIKFTITLRDEPVQAMYRADHEPEVVEKGGKR